MYSDNTSSEPMQHFDAGTIHTNPRIAKTQSRNTPIQTQISNLDERCQCEDDEMDHTGIQYRSSFARQLQQSEAIPKYYTKQPV